jgi:putative zinc finger protein
VSCDEVRLSLPDYALGTLSETESVAVRRHLRGCSTCRAEAADLDEGVALFARAAHQAEPPAELKGRVMSVLEEEWAEAPAPHRKVRRLAVAWQAVAALVILLAGVAAWAGVAQSNANRFRGDSISYHAFLSALGGKDVRVGQLAPIAGMTLEGNVILYDSDKGQSWVLVLARAPGFADPVTVSLTGDGKTIKVPFPLEFDPDGEGWTGLVTSTDISGFDQVLLTDSSGRVIARADVLAKTLSD